MNDMIESWVVTSVPAGYPGSNLGQIVINVISDGALIDSEEEIRQVLICT